MEEVSTSAVSNKNADPDLSYLDLYVFQYWVNEYSEEE